MDLKTINNNIISNEWDKRYDNLLPEIKEKLDLLEKSKPREYLFKKKKNDKSYPDVGTVFEMVTPQNIIINGLVINNNINSILGRDLITIIIFKLSTEIASMEKMNICSEEILIPPMIITSELWTKGYAKNIGNIIYDLKVEYSFYDVITRKFFTDKGEIDEKKGMTGIYGVSTVNGLSRQIQRELIIQGLI